VGWHNWCWRQGMNAHKADGQGTFFKSGEDRTASIWTLSVPGFLQIILLWRWNANLSCLRGTLMHSLCQIRENTPQSWSEMIHWLLL
jgi:hypothetical protein